MTQPTMRNQKNRRASPEIARDWLISTLKTNGPKAATAAVHPITPAAFLGEFEKITGYCLNVAAFPIPVKKNIQRIIAKNALKSFLLVGVRYPPKIKVRKRRIKHNPVSCVRNAPPILSATFPKIILVADPISGP